MLVQLQDLNLNVGEFLLRARDVTSSSLLVILFCRCQIWNLKNTLTERRCGGVACTCSG